ncbi:glycogen debranching protein GlgX [Cytophagaceae bacterium DM2B3-1]|uniref:Glycogen debranching protein GlgX n=1 Tax=Xanthocytophaga flava TaxID=3048013 RepID=A0ABT7CKV8_9BACT|nr:glycogen debranching protein GlgX [Xanthocytophaga flavus]MDJ1494356.1 glycogen debranching protein GlgX [Xanthocytophaga flavus]
MQTDTSSVAESEAFTITHNKQFFSTPHSWLGKPYPLGATYDGKGVNFALFSEHAEAVELCLFDINNPSKETARIRITEQTDYVWHIYLPHITPGQLYGYRVYGPFDPENGLLFNPSKLLLDPYAKAIWGDINWDPSMFGYNILSDKEDRYNETNNEDNAEHTMKSVVIDSAFDWDDDEKPAIPMQETIIYELHVKGFTVQHPSISEKIKGSYAGVAAPESIEYLKKLGITTVELMPVHQFVQDSHLQEKGLHNYWGYNTIGFFAPHREYASSTEPYGQVTEFKQMIKDLHKAGIEVILDVVYNHTAEGNHFGPILSFKGIDNQAYYRLVEDNPLYYNDFTGTGNTLNMLHPRSLQLVMDSLRYWVTEMHVDGFRFDLAPALARGLYEVGKLSNFLDTIHQDPIISQVKLIAEPWDIGEGGYQVGNFPVQWAEWNGKYRDCVRKFWKGDESQIAEMAYRLSGSSDLYQTNGRLPSASVNFIVAHDGFTLHDLVSYNEKHNDANGEENRDGHNENESWNCGAEGPTDDKEIIALREKQKRNFLSTLLLSQGVPMICSGDEYGRTQNGNNNAYCQDNEISWFNWNWTDDQKKQFEFVQELIRIRKENPMLHRRKFFTGRPIHGSHIADIRWLTPNGEDMTEEEWHNGLTKCTGMLLNGQVMDEYDEKGQHVKGDILLLLFNSHHETVPFVLPGKKNEPAWHLWIDTETGGVTPSKQVACGTVVQLAARSFMLFCQPA